MIDSLEKIKPSKEIDRIVAFIKATFAKAGKSTAVIGLSGGIDSATVLFFTVKALGADHVQVYSLPAKHSDPIHVADAQAAAKAVALSEAHFHHIPIAGIVQKSWRTISRNTPHLTHQPSSLRLANLKARIRMQILFDQAKALDALVMGTENRSEMLLGYFTRFGDQASDVEPVSHLYKTQVIDLAKALGVPDSIINKPPTADLWPGQSDAAELGFTYQEADPILSLFEQGKSPAAMKAAGFDKTLVDKVIATVKASAFKHQVPHHL